MTILIFSLVPAISHAQFFTEVPQSGGLVAPSLPTDLNFGTNTPDLKDVDFGDLDNDGDLDIYVFASDDDLTGGSEFLDRIILNGNLTGKLGAFLEIPVVNSSGVPSIPISEFDAPTSTGQRTYDGDLVDVDNDGDLDVLRSDFSGIYLLLNNGNATFEFRPDLMPTKAQIRTGVGISNFDGIGVIYFDGVDAVDVDADGDKDAIIANYNTSESLYLINCWNSPGAGASRCTVAEGFAIGNRDGDVFDTLSNERTHGITFGDIDVGVAPNLPDVFLTNTDMGSASILLRNTGLSGDGTGRVVFTDVTASNMPADGSNTREAVDAELEDIDGDGDLDLYVVNRRQNNTLFWNDGNGNFTSLGSPGLPAQGGGNLSSYDLQIADFDDDGDLDVLEAWGEESGGAVTNNRLLNNTGGTNGSISFSIEPQPFGPRPSHRLTISAGDFDGDLDIDVVAGNFDANNVVLYENNLYDPVDEVIDLVITVDKTGSMTATDGLENMRIDRARNAAKSVYGALTVSAADDRVGLTEFAIEGDSQQLIGLTEFPSQTVFDLVVDNIPANGFATSAGSALRQSLDNLTANSIPFRPQSMLIITDGLHNSSPLPQDVINADHGGVWPSGISYNVVSIAAELNPEFENIVTNGSNFYFSQTGLDLVEFGADAEADVTGKLVLDIQTTAPAPIPFALDDVDLFSANSAKSLISASASTTPNSSTPDAPWTMNYATPQQTIAVNVSATIPTMATLKVFNNRMHLLAETEVEVGTTQTFIGLKSTIANIVTAKLETSGNTVTVVEALQGSSENVLQPTAAIQLSPNDTSEIHTFTISPDDRQFRATLTWQDPSHSPSFELFDPNGKQVTSENIRVETNSGSVFEVIKVKRPLPGVWQARELRPTAERTFVSVLTTSGPVSSSGLNPLNTFEFNVSPSRFRNFLDEPLLIDVNISSGLLNNGRASVVALITDPQGKISQLPAVDLGEGYFQVVFDNTPFEGNYDVRIQVAIDGNAGLTRALTRRFTVPVSAMQAEEICDENSNISVNPDSLVADGNSQALVTAKLTTCSGSSFIARADEVQFAATGGTYVGSVQSQGNGIYSRLLQAPTTSGNVEVSTTVSGRRVQTTANINFIVGDVDPTLTQLQLNNSEGFVRAVAGATAIVQVNPVDSFGNSLGSSALVNLTVDPSSTIPADVIGPQVTPTGEFTFNVNIIGTPSTGTIIVTGNVNGVALTKTLAIKVLSENNMEKDSDNDGIVDGIDNCLSIPNPNQTDDNLDGVGNACENGQFFCGDFDINGRVNTRDARLIQRCAVGILECPTTCDVTGDNNCNTIDARVIQRYVVGQLPGSLLICNGGLSSK